MHLTEPLLGEARKIMKRPVTFGSVAAGLCMQLTDDEESIFMDPAVLDAALSDILGEDSVNADVLQRIHAVATVLQDRRFFEDPVVFHAVCATLLDPDAVPLPTLGPPSPLEMAWSCTEVALLLGDLYSTDLYTPQVCRYCGIALNYEGLSFAPPILSFADFPADRYPDPEKYADETVLGAWVDSQESRVKDISSDVVSLGNAYKAQLIELRPFGADEDLISALTSG